MINFELLPLLKIVDSWSYKQEVSRIYRPELISEKHKFVENKENEERFRKKKELIKVMAPDLIAVIRMVVSFKRSLEDMSFFIP